MDLFNKVLNKVESFNSKQVLIHSDIMRGFPVTFINRNDFVISHMELLKRLYSNSTTICMPSFNYTYCKDGVYSINVSSSQLGVLSDYFRKNISEWRTHVPVFSFSGIGEKIDLPFHKITDPFDSNSAFHILNKNNGLLMHYGSEFKHTTFIHYIERMTGKLFYRYDKIFKGEVILADNTKKQIELLFHVRPLGYHLDYDWHKIITDLKENEILFEFNEGNTCISLLEINKMCSFLIEKMTENNLYLLDNESLKWVKPKLDELGRPFILTDFEKL